MAPSIHIAPSAKRRIQAQPTSIHKVDANSGLVPFVDDGRRAIDVAIAAIPRVAGYFKVDDWLATFRVDDVSDRAVLFAAETLRARRAAGPRKGAVGVIIVPEGTSRSAYAHLLSALSEEGIDVVVDDDDLLDDLVATAARRRARKANAPRG
jgi:hypothetical protein